MMLKRAKSRTLCPSSVDEFILSMGVSISEAIHCQDLRRSIERTNFGFWNSLSDRFLRRYINKMKCQENFCVIGLFVTVCQVNLFGINILRNNRINWEI